MASYVFYPGDGVQTDWTVPFPYLSKSHVKVSVAGVPVTYTWLNTSLIRVSPAVANGAMLLVKRQTPTTPLTQFENTNNLTAENLTLAETQSLYIAQEAADRADQSIAVDDASGQYDFNNRRSTSVADPVDAQDAATKHWAETAMSSQLAQATDAKDTSVAAKVASEAARDVSITKANATAADALATAADRAQTALDRVATGQDRTTVAADKATVAADKATVLTAKGDTFDARDVAVSAKDTATAKAASAAASETVTVNKAQIATDAAAAAQAAAASVDAANLLTKSGNLSGLADKSAARSNLDLGNSAVKNIASVSDIKSKTNTDVLTTDKAWDASKWQPLGNISGSVAVDASTGSRFYATLVGNVIIDVANLKDGQPFEITLIQDATGSRTVGWASKFKWPGAQVPSVATAASAIALVASCEGTWDANIVLGAAWKVS